MAGLVFVRRGSEYIVEDTLFVNGPSGTSAEASHKIVDEEFGRIDDIIADLEAKILALKRHRNGLPAVSRLPDDLLVEIWKHLAYSRPQSKDWLGVTHVCSRWRQVALDSPSLWQEPLFGTEEMTSEMIRRSQNTGLSFEIEFKVLQSELEDRAYNQRRLKTVQENMYRVKTLSLDSPRTLKFKSAPLLTTLSIIHPLRESDVLVKFFGGSCLNLTHVTLTRCELLTYPESIQPHPRVTDLFISASLRPKASFHQAIASLKKFPNLRKLSLQYVFSGETTDVDTQRDLGTLRFSELETLCVEAALADSLRFLDLIHYPTSTSVLIKTNQWLRSRDISVLNSLIGRFDSGPKSLVVNRVIGLKSKEKYYNLFFESPGDASKPRGGRLTLESITELTEEARVLLLLPSLPILHELHALNYFAPATDSTEEFWSACGNLPLLETLKLKCDQPELLKILALPESTKDGHILRPYFPSLRTLILQDNPDRHGSFAEYSGGRGLSMAFGEECRRVAKVRKEEFHEMFEYKVLVI